RIEQATLGYKEWAPKARAEDVHLTRVWACASSWILMDFVDGVPLSELYQRRRFGPTSRVDLPELRRYGAALFAALRQFDERFNQDKSRPHRVHGDLSPSNIIVGGREQTPVIHLIDVGRNYLYAHSAIFGAEGTDGSYIAPEVKRGDAEDAIADADVF